MEQFSTDNLEPQESLTSLLNEITTDEEDDSLIQITNDLEKQDDADDNLSISDNYNDNDDDDDTLSRAKGSYFHIPYGFQSLGSYKHASKNCEICGGMRKAE